MFTQLMERKSVYAVQKLYELEQPIKGYNQVIVSCKPNGANGLKGSFFIWGTKDGNSIENELDWDTADCDFIHDKVLTDRINRGRGVNTPKTKFRCKTEKLTINTVEVRSEQLMCSHCGRPFKEHNKDSGKCPV